jgi:ubiquinone/menaquinone biosynthesis C-methylase UbiE
MLPVSGIDAVLISFAYHEMVEHEAMLAHIRSALRADGRLVVIEAISEKNRQVPRERQIKDHELSPDILTGELKAAGFEIPNGVEALSDHDGVLRYLLAARLPK